MDEEKHLMPDERTSEKESTEVGIEQTVDRALGKYISVWIWSVLLGTSIGLVYSFIGYRPTDRWGILGILLVVLLAIGSITALISLIYLFQYLSRFLVPVLYHRPDKVAQNELNWFSARLLKRAISFIIAAIIVRGIMAVVELLYASVRF